MSHETRFPLAIVAAAVSASPAFAQFDVSENQTEPVVSASGAVMIVSQYRLRGISLSNEHPALQGTIHLNHESGFYAGVWSSTLAGYGKFGGSNVELDLYGGWQGKVTKSLTFDAGMLYFAYPGSDASFGLFEPYVKLIGVTGPVTSILGAAYAWEQQALEDKENLYLFFDNSLQIEGAPILLTAHIGRSGGGSALAAGGNYWDWSLGGTTSWRNLLIGISYVDTDIDESQARSFGATKAIVDGAIVATLGVSF